MKASGPASALAALLAIYAAASLAHFVHNAEFLPDYPGLPASWTRGGVYLAWLGMTAVGVGGWLLVRYGHLIRGLLLIVIYAACGLDSLGHYVVAPMSAHSAAMNATILFEVIAAAAVMIEAARMLVKRLMQWQANGSHKSG